MRKKSAIFNQIYPSHPTNLFFIISVRYEVSISSLYTRRWYVADNAGVPKHEFFAVLYLYAYFCSNYQLYGVSASFTDICRVCRCYQGNEKIVCTYAYCPTFHGR